MIHKPLTGHTILPLRGWLRQNSLPNVQSGYVCVLILIRFERIQGLLSMSPTSGNCIPLEPRYTPPYFFEEQSSGLSLFHQLGVLLIAL